MKENINISNRPNRFTVSSVQQGSEMSSYRNEAPLNLEERNSQTVPAITSNNNMKSGWEQLTIEALPRLDNYRLSKRHFTRPSIGELIGDQNKSQELDQVATPAAHGHGIKLGWIQGVLIPCLLNIWGVMLFLRLSWVVGQAGILESLIIIAISTIVCVITTLSLSALTTNGDVKSGGVYYILSRSLGPEFGASIGIVFAFANTVAASMNTIGFCASLNDLLKSYDLKIIDGATNDVRIVGVPAILIMVIVCAVGMDWEAKAQNFLVITIVAAIIDYVVGTILGPTSNEEIAQGFVGFSTETFNSNWLPGYRFSEGLNQDFFSVFAIFFPSVTGIQAGANICGDLKDPASAIPKGTLLSLLISMSSYALFVFFAGGAELRDASGNISDIANHTISSCAQTDKGCEFGLYNSYSVMQLMSAWWPLIYAGCFAATLSTALTNLLSVPRLIQALGIDGIYPGLKFFAKGYGKHGEPYRGYVLVFIISSAFLIIADLNLIAPLISTFYLASYALINFCTFHAGYIKPLGWRPSFRFYNIWLSLFGFLLCVAIMFLIDWLSALITFIIIFALYLVVVYRKPDVNWGSSTQAQTYKTALTSAHRLTHIGDHIKNYRPQVLVLAGHPVERPPLVDLADLITKNNSLLIVGDVYKAKISHREREQHSTEARKWFEVKKIKAFYNLIDGIGFEEGARALIQATGFGKLSPNIVLLGYKRDWMICHRNDLIEYFNVLQNAFDNRMSVAILRLPHGIDFSHLNTEIQIDSVSNLTANNSATNLNRLAVDNLGSRMMHCDSNLNMAAMAQSNSTTNINTLAPAQPAAVPSPNTLKVLQRERIIYSTRGGSGVPKDVIEAMTIFDDKKPKGSTIDVWWLYDDGGLTVLLPYILSTRATYANCKIRVFALTNNRQESELEERNMVNLLAKLRIDFSSLTMLQGVTEKPKEATINLHRQLLNGFVEGQAPDFLVSRSELQQLQEKTYRQLRLREMLLQHSSKASLIVMSLPMPRQGSVSSPLYMSWLEMLTRDMPPVLLVRGNQTSVLTFYS